MELSSLRCWLHPTACTFPTGRLLHVACVLRADGSFHCNAGGKPVRYFDLGTTASNCSNTTKNGDGTCKPVHLRAGYRGQATYPFRSCLGMAHTFAEEDPGARATHRLKRQQTSVHTQGWVFGLPRACCCCCCAVQCLLCQNALN